MTALRAGLTRLTGLAACLVPSVLLSWAMTRGILQVWSLSVPPWQLAGLCALWCCLFAGLFTNLRTVLATLILAAAGAVVVWAGGLWPVCLQALAEPGPLYGILISGGCAMAAMALSRRRVLLPPLIILAGGCWLLLTVAGSPPGLTEAAVICVALVAYTARSALHRWSGVSTAASDGHLALWVLPVAALLSLVCWALIAPAQQLPKSEYLAQKLEYLNHYFMDLTGTSAPRTSFSLIHTGMQPDPLQLGGPVEPYDEDVLTVVTDDPSLLLRGAVYSEYNGHVWYNSRPVTRYRLSDGARADAVFDRGLPADGSLPLRSVTARITHLTDGPSSLFVPFRLQSLTPAEILTLLVYFNDRGEVFSVQDVEAGVSYALEAVLPTTDLDTLSQWLSAHPGAGEDPGYALACSEYLSLPETLPVSVYTLADQLASQAENSAQAVALLARYLSANTVYSLTPVVPPADEDFVAHFLSTGTGYCTYYASAMTVMARTLGIPARYVEGYRLPAEARAGEPVTVSQSEAHAWCEVYLPSLGWIPVDVSARDGHSQPQQEPIPQQTPPPRDPQPTATPTAAVQPAVTPQPTPRPESAPAAPFPWGTVLWIAAALAAAAAVILGPPLVRRLWEERCCRTLSGALRCHYRGILRLLGYVGLSPQVGETPAQFALRVDALLPMRRSCADVARVVMELTYGPPSEPTAQQVEVLLQYRSRLKRAIRSGRGWWFYTLRETLRIRR